MDSVTGIDSILPSYPDAQTLSLRVSAKSFLCMVVSGTGIPDADTQVPQRRERIFGLQNLGPTWRGINTPR
jgi:hypothetical protein